MINIVAVQELIVNAALIPFAAFGWISSIFSYTSFGIAGWIVIFVLAFTMIPVDFIRKALANSVSIRK